MKYDSKRQSPNTPGDLFLKHMSEVFKDELERRGLNKHEFYRHNAVLISATTFNRMLDGETGTNVRLVADVADALGYELRLIRKQETDIDDEFED